MFKRAQTGLKLLALAAVVAVAITDLGSMLDADGSDLKLFGRHRRGADGSGSGYGWSGYDTDDADDADEADVGKGQTAVKTAVIRFVLDLGVDVTKIEADDLAEVKAYFGKEIAKAAGDTFSYADILAIYFLYMDEDGVEKKLRGRRATAPGPIQTEIILKEDSGFDVDKIDAAITKTLEAGDLNLEVTVGGVTYTATVTIDDYDGVEVENIAVNDGDMPKSAKKDGGLSGGAIAGIVIGTLILVAVVVFIIVKKPCASGNKQISPAGGGRTPAY